MSPLSVTLSRTFDGFAGSTLPRGKGWGGGEKNQTSLVINSHK